VKLGQMRGQVVAWLGLQDITSYDETNLVEDKLYQGVVDLLSRTRCVVRCVQLRTQANVDEYTLDHSIIGVVDIDNGTKRRMRRDQVEGLAETPTGADPGFTLIRADVLRVTPIPSEDGQLIQVWAVLKPQQMTADTDSPGDELYGAIPEEYHDAIVGYALWKCADYADDATAQNGEYYRQLYEGPDGRGGRLAQIKILVNKRGTARGPRSQVRLRSISSPGA